MEEHFYYQEEIYFTRDNSRELGENQEKIVEMLRSNLAVGVVGGFYEEGYPVYFISHFALNNLGLSFGEFMERTGGSFLKAIYEEDQPVFEAPSGPGEKDVREYRMLSHDGTPLWVNEARTMSLTGDGRRIWVCSLRLIDEEYRRQRLNQEAFSLMKDTYYRISSVDLGRNRIETLKLEEEEQREEEKFQGDYRRVLEYFVQRHVEEEFQEKVRNVLSPGNLRAVLRASGKPLSITYRRMLQGKSIWVRSEVIPMGGYTQENPVVMWYVKNMAEESAREKNLSDTLLTDNASLRKSLSEEEQYRQAIISEALFVFNVNVSANLIEEDFYRFKGGGTRLFCPWWGCRPPVTRMPFLAGGGSGRYPGRTGRIMTAASTCSI